MLISLLIIYMVSLPQVHRKRMRSPFYANKSVHMADLTENDQKYPAHNIEKSAASFLDPTLLKSLTPPMQQFLVSKQSLPTMQPNSSSSKSIKLSSTHVNTNTCSKDLSSSVLRNLLVSGRDDTEDHYCILPYTNKQSPSLQSNSDLPSCSKSEESITLLASSDLDEAIGVGSISNKIIPDDDDTSITCISSPINSPTDNTSISLSTNDCPIISCSQVKEILSKQSHLQYNRRKSTYKEKFVQTEEQMPQSSNQSGPSNSVRYKSVPILLRKSPSGDIKFVRLAPENQSTSTKTNLSSFKAKKISSFIPQQILPRKSSATRYPNILPKV